MTLAFCWAHVRRVFYELQAGSPAPIAAEALLRIGKLYAIEAEVHDRPAEGRCRVRKARARPILGALKPWLEAKLATMSAKSAVAEAIRYVLTCWDELTGYLDDGQIEMTATSLNGRLNCAGFPGGF